MKASRPHKCTGSNAALGKYPSCKNEDIGPTCVTDPNSENADRKFPLEVVRDWDELYAEYNELEDEQKRVRTTVNNGNNISKNTMKKENEEKNERQAFIEL